MRSLRPSAALWRRTIHPSLAAWLCLALFPGLICLPAQSQLATSFYNVTGVQTRTLPNAVQVTIRTDGTVTFGTDLFDLLRLTDNDVEPKETATLRVRLLRARARLPAFINIGSYPVDSAQVTLGSEEMQFPFFSEGNGMEEPRVDILLHFFVPVRVQRFILNRNARDSREEDGGEGINFVEFLGPRDVSVEIGPDRRSIIITVITDRLDSGRAANIRRSPPANRRHTFSLQPLPDNRFRVSALHTPLPELLAEVAEASGVALTARADADRLEVSLTLPDATLEELLNTLTVAYGLTVLARPPEEGGGFSVGRNGAVSVTERLPLRYLDPDQARLLFPDFLLSSLKTDRENKSLIFSGLPTLAARLRKDLGKLDRPPAQVRVELSVWEVTSTEDFQYALETAYQSGSERIRLFSPLSELSVLLQPGQEKLFSASMNALATSGRARIQARPSVVVASGKSGVLFVGQQRYITVLQSRFGTQNVEALRLPIGYTLNVSPTVGAEKDITLELTARLSTVDSVERGTGLPTLGIREMISVIRLRPGQTALLAGLTENLQFDNRLGPGVGAKAMPDIPFGARQNSRARRRTILLVTAQEV
jgi:hypothetical protein